MPRGPNPSDAEINVQLKGLVALDISGNEFTDKSIGNVNLDGSIGMGPIGKVLSRDDWLVAFNLLDNNITENGAHVLRKVLEENESLAAIDFRPKPVVPKELLDGDRGKIRPNLTGELPKPILYQLGRRDPKTAGWMMTRMPKKGMVSTHEYMRNILARWGWFGLREGEQAEKSLPSTNRKKVKARQKAKASTKGKGRENIKASINTSTRMKRSRQAGKVTAKARKNTSVKASSKPRKVSTGLTRRKKSNKKVGKSKKESASTASVKVTIPRPKSAPSGDVSRSRLPKSRMERADIAAARISGAQPRPKTARGSRPRYTQRTNNFGFESPLAFNASTRPPQIEAVDLRLSPEAIDALRSIFRRVVMLDADTDDLDADKEPSAPLKDLIAEIKRDVSASALLNIPGSTPRNTDAPTLTSQRMSWSMLLQFFSERAEKATIIAKSPRKKNSDITFPNSPRILVDGVVEGNELEVLNMLEDWVSQMHQFIDKAEENPSLLNTSAKKSKKKRTPTKSTPEKNEREVEAVAMSPDEVRNAIASRLKDMFDV